MFMDIAKPDSLSALLSMGVEEINKVPLQKHHRRQLIGWINAAHSKSYAPADEVATTPRKKYRSYGSKAKDMAL